MSRPFTRSIFILLLIASGLAHGASAAREFTAKIVAVLDGDTVLIRQKGGVLKIRLAEIDAPEKAQTFGETSRRSLSDMVLGKQVKVVSQAVDQYGRMVAHLSVDGLDVNAEQIRRGMAWEYSHFHSNQVLIALQEEARQAPRGLWALSDPIQPGEWRKQHPNLSTPTSRPHGATAPAMPLAERCGSKNNCSEMVSCDEAKHYLSQCGIKTLDGDGDGTPCEQLCMPAQKTEVIP